MPRMTPVHTAVHTLCIRTGRLPLVNEQGCGVVA